MQAATARRAGRQRPHDLSFTQLSPLSIFDAPLRRPVHAMGGAQAAVDAHFAANALSHARLAVPLCIARASRLAYEVNGPE
jgi:hypothetical protein